MIYLQQYYIYVRKIFMIRNQITKFPKILCHENLELRWNPSKADTIGTKNFVHYSEVSLAQGWWLTTPLLWL